jgi:hypothetical protein
MPCYLCAARQTDPGKGPSEWKRGVVGGTQVLVCPACQRAHDWTADLDRCTSCGSTMLVRALGETRCRECGSAVVVGDGRGGALADEALAADVSAALERHFGGPGDVPTP